MSQSLGSFRHLAGEQPLVGGSSLPEDLLVLTSKTINAYRFAARKPTKIETTEETT
jgi:hypothetical protein